VTGWRILCGGLVAVAVSATAGAGLGVLGGRLTPLAADLSLVLGLAAGLVAGRAASAPRQPVTVATAILFAVLALAALRAFLWVIYPSGVNVLVLSPHNLGDMALHLNLIHRWVRGGEFWPDNPFLAGAAFAYHPGMDLWNVLLALAGVPVVEGLRWAGLLGAAAAGAALWRWGGSFALAAFLFAGGLAGLVLLQGGSLDPLETGTAWKNLFLSMFVTQRGLLYALPAGLVLLTVWRAQLRGETDGPSLPPLAQMALYAAMPLFNAPAFLFLSFALAACALAAWPSGRAKPFLVTGVVSLIPASWLVHLVTVGFTAGSAVRFAPGWMQGDGGIVFWLWNFGLFLPLVAWLGFALFRGGREDLAACTFYLVGVVTLCFSFLFLIAPWEWDNTKLIIWGYLALVPLLWSHLIAAWPAWARAACVAILFFSGCLALWVGLDSRHGYTLAERAEWAAAEGMTRRLGPDARVATAPGWDHPLMLLGQPVAIGYEGHLFSQGLDYGPARRQLDRLMSGGDGWKDAARDLGVRYLFWGRREQALWPASQRGWESVAPRVARSPQGDLYHLTPALLQD
jgi:hypothetical protein